MIKIDWRSFWKKRTPLQGGFPVGMVLFTGPQGGGKTLSQSRYTWQLQNAWNAKVYSSTNYKPADVKIEESEIPEYILTPRESRPTVFLLDEIQVLLGNDNLKSEDRSKITKAIQQQRKRNTSIIGTLQVYLDIAPIYRRQVKYVVRCSKFFNIQIERWMEGETLQFDQEKNKYVGSTAHLKIWKRHNDMFDLYDTFEVVGDDKKEGSSPM